MRKLAERIIALETRQNKLSGANSSAIFPVAMKLHAPLAALVGNAGFGALLSRSLVLASPQAPWLRMVHVNADASLAGPGDLETRVAPGAIVAGRVALLAQLLDLLKAFIGEDMTIQLMSEIWPNLVLTQSRSGSGD
jgi:hypothetical protein